MEKKMASRPKEEMFRRMRREMMMLRRGYGRDREYFRMMEMEMMMMHEMYGEDMDFDPEEFERFFARERPKPEPVDIEAENKRRDRDQLVYWINCQMMPESVGYHGNAHNLQQDLVRFVKEGKFKAIIDDTHRFQVNYLSYRDIPTDYDLCVEMCRFATAAFNNREQDYEKVFVLLCGVEEDLDTKTHPLATGLPYLDPDKREEVFALYSRLLKRGTTRRCRLKDSEFSSIDEGMTKFSIVHCEQKAARHSKPIPPIAVFSVHPCWVFCTGWTYYFGLVDENRRWKPKAHEFINDRAQPLLDVEAIEAMEQLLSEGYENYRKSKYY